MVRHVAPEQVPPRRVRLPELERADGRDDGVARDRVAILVGGVVVRQLGSVQLQLPTKRITTVRFLLIDTTSKSFTA